MNDRHPDDPQYGADDRPIRTYFDEITESAPIGLTPAQHARYLAAVALFQERRK